ncbi:hypothetical protein [Pseudolysinimonas yzui]|uniref:Uncharacterized protein n=1 Tax=Pseudolysinimonas yzui TaxID=2708254 RepID=A0A8J3GSB6_9MICO|nr:hypothetical protein [Pseudolysinimonas yzui]GHF23111.1 hypothetical protein GCM10011600_25400 [Pseudolysinimonas yzui]
MTVPKWLIPLLAVIAAVAVGVAATLIGLRFAPVETVTASPVTEIVPVLSPIAEGEDAPAGPDDEGEPDAPVVVSEAAAEREVTVPAAPSGDEAVDPSLSFYLDELMAWPDALLGLINFGGDERSDGDDPCAPRDGEPPVTCPDGLRSTILSDTALRDFAAGGQAFPPTYEEYLENGNPYGGSLWCDGLTAGEGEVPFGILATAPGTFTVRYWPTENPGAERETVVTTTAEQLALWEEQVALPDGWPIVQQCFVIDGIEPDTAYTAVVTGIDTFLRIAPAHTVRFHSEGAPVHPGLQVNPVGDNLLFVSGLYPTDETLDIRAYLVPADAAPACTAPAGATQLTPLTTVDVVAERDEVNAVNALPDFQRKAVRTFVIPEGATAIVCGRWFPAGGAPSWESSQPNFESSAVVQAADRVLPSVSLFDVARFDDAVESMDVRVASAEGIECWNWTWTRERDGDLPVELCDASLFAGGGVASDGEHLWARGFRGDLTVTVTTQLDTGETSETSYLLPAADDGCRGVCEPPARQWFRVALEDVTQGTGLCGSFFGSDCTPPSREVAAGTATFFVDWEQGLSNGRTDWNITPTVDLPRDYVQPDVPQLDNDEYWTFTEPSLSIPWSAATLDVVVDRPVDYTLRFLGGGGVATRCDNGSLAEVSGSSISAGGRDTIRLQMGGLCLGAQYLVEVELVDAEGRRTIWGLDRAGSWWGGTALVIAPALRAEIFYDVLAQHSSRSYLRVFELEINGASTGAEETRSGRCLDDGLIFSSGSYERDLYNVNSVTLSILVGEATRWGDAEAWGADCLSVPTDDAARTATADVDLHQLFSPEGVVVSVPELYSATVTLRARLLD